jgi:hypothetical protein
MPPEGGGVASCCRYATDLCPSPSCMPQRSGQRCAPKLVSAVLLGSFVTVYSANRVTSLSICGSTTIDNAMVCAISPLLRRAYKICSARFREVNDFATQDFVPVSISHTVEWISPTTMTSLNGYGPVKQLLGILSH